MAALKVGIIVAKALILKHQGRSIPTFKVVL